MNEQALKEGAFKANRKRSKKVFSRSMEIASSRAFFGEALPFEISK